MGPGSIDTYQRTRSSRQLSRQGHILKARFKRNTAAKYIHIMIYMYIVRFLRPTVKGRKLQRTKVSQQDKKMAKPIWHYMEISFATPQHVTLTSQLDPLGKYEHLQIVSTKN